ncbi:hypothetical protein [Bifidobacterium sp.]
MASTSRHAGLRGEVLMNGAEYLLCLFEVEERPDGFDTSANVAFMALSETERMGKRLQDMQVKRIGMAMRQLPRIWGQLIRSYGDRNNNGMYNAFSPDLHHVETLDDASVLALQSIADRWIDQRLTMNDNANGKISEAVSHLAEQLRADASIPVALKAYTISLAQHIRSLLERFDAGEHVDIGAALKELLAALAMVEASSTDKNRWAEFREKYVTPIFVGLTVELPGLILQTAPLISGLLGQ